jgi:hypothetical protein
MGEDEASLDDFLNGPRQDLYDMINLGNMYHLFKQRNSGRKGYVPTISATQSKIL